MLRSAITTACWSIALTATMSVASSQEKEYAADTRTPTDIPAVDRLFVDFVEKHRVPGCSVAITANSRLVYARGFGLADVEKRTPVDAKSLFRIASISKPITAVAILKLIEQDKLKLDDRVTDILPEMIPPDVKVDERLRRITIRQLLEHRGGWDREKSFDPMFQSARFAKAMEKPSPADANDIIRCMADQPLDFTPGERYAYSNYGYCLLGRVIEKMSKQSYEDYVKREVLTPLGIHSTRIGGSRFKDRAEREVCYYDPSSVTSVFASDRGATVPAPYGGFHLESLDAHGGWLASASDLVRFARAFDAPEQYPVLNSASIRTMFARPAGDSKPDAAGKMPETYYALGWMMRPVGERITTWHTGSLPGTATILIRRYDGLNIAVLMNSRTSPHTGNLIRALEGPLHRAIDSVKEWPAEDFQYGDRPK